MSTETDGGVAALPPKRRSKSIAGPLITCILLFGVGAIEWSTKRSSLIELAQRIVDDNVSGNTLAINHISMPIYMAIPFSSWLMSVGVLPSEYNGYFSFAKKSGTLSSRCEAETVEFKLRTLDADRVAMTITNDGLRTLRRCQ